MAPAVDASEATLPVDTEAEVAARAAHQPTSDSRPRLLSLSTTLQRTTSSTLQKTPGTVEGLGGAVLAIRPLHAGADRSYTQTTMIGQDASAVTIRLEPELVITRQPSADSTTLRPHQRTFVADDGNEQVGVEGVDRAAVSADGGGGGGVGAEGIVETDGTTDRDRESEEESRPSAGGWGDC
ncbi:uncharacterized protein AB675_2918 [Cyphellophora attinorum]|jgi:hypothetical protein|uniref:Uncharacterized protein n=1 Tax=Cyphellophora attinorum TaxID=1664694 RepID=A0A0N0NJ14_9EURO|nr:uncharacterized protein AB675_2918 [Phialophora attinorum]KPI36461.1 hypothetical protein AB675_2918 [Phialophora attinorum]